MRVGFLPISGVARQRAEAGAKDLRPRPRHYLNHVILAMIMVATSWSATAGSLTFGERRALAELDRFFVIVSIESKDTACKPNHDEIETAAAFILNQTKWRYVRWAEFMTDWKTIGTLMIAGDALQTKSGQCVYHVEISASAWVAGTLQHNNQEWTGNVELWSSGEYGITPPDDLTADLVRFTETALKRLAVTVSEEDRARNRKE
jgi:hypothetical protein